MPAPLLTDDQLAALVRFLLSRFRAVVREKGSAVEMWAVATAFSVIGLFRAGLPSSDEFLTHFWTALGPVVYAPRGHGPLHQHARVLCHELTHVVQFWRDPVDFVRRYCTARGRAELEAESERGAIESWFILTGALPYGVAALDVTRHGYDLDEGHADLTRDLLETACASVAQGVVSTDVGLAVLSWLKANAPDAIAAPALRAPGSEARS
jgi:hypothetical protein